MVSYSMECKKELYDLSLKKYECCDVERSPGDQNMHASSATEKELGYGLAESMVDASGYCGVKVQRPCVVISGQPPFGDDV